MIDSSLWNALVTFHHCGTLSAAAEKLYVSQPSLSSAMKRLEKELGIPLFERSKNRLVLNEIGIEAVELAEKHIRAEQEMILHLQEVFRRLNALTVASYVSGLRKILADCLSNLYPDKEIIMEHISSTQLARGLLEGRFDYVITEYPIDEPGVQCVHYLTDRLLVRLPKNDPLAERKSVTIQDLADSKLLVWTQSGFWASHIRKKFAAEQLVFVHDEQEYYDLIHAFDMRSFTLDSVIANREQQDRYRFVPFDDAAMKVPFYICCLQQNAYLLPSLLPRI